MFSKFFLSLSPAKKIAYVAVFLALSVAANSILDIDIGASNKITFTYTVGFLTAYALGAVPAFFIGFAGDGIGFLLKPSNAYWLFGVTIGLFGFFVGIFIHYLPLKGKVAPYIKAVIALVFCYLVITLVLNSVVNYYFVKIFMYHGDWNKAFFVYLGGRIGLQSLVYGVNFALCVAFVPALERILPKLQKKRT